MLSGAYTLSPRRRTGDHPLRHPAATRSPCMIRRSAFLVVLALAAIAASLAAEPPPSRTMILSTTTSTQDSGLLDVLVPLFERHTGYSVKTISAGTGQALALAARGEADVTLAHAPALEKKYVEDGKMLN